MATHLNESKTNTITIMKIIITKDTLDFESNHGSVERSTRAKSAIRWIHFHQNTRRYRHKSAKEMNRKKATTIATNLKFVFLSKKHTVVIRCTHIVCHSVESIYSPSNKQRWNIFSSFRSTCARFCTFFFHFSHSRILFRHSILFCDSLWVVIRTTYMLVVIIVCGICIFMWWNFYLQTEIIYFICSIFNLVYRFSIYSKASHIVYLDWNLSVLLIIETQNDTIDNWWCKTVAGQTNSLWNRH